jgi:hypothetical protein
MATKNIVPRATGGGGLGTAAKGWGGLFVTNIAASSATEGGKVSLAADGPWPMASGHRLGVIEFKGAEDGAGTPGNTLTIGARIEAVTDTIWSDTENGASLKFYTTDGNASESVALTLDSGNVATFTGSVSLGTRAELNSTTTTTDNSFNIDCDSLTTGTALNLDIDDALTTTAAKSLVKIDYDKAGVTASGQTSTTTGLDINIADAATNHVSGAVIMTGVQIDVDSANAQGTITQKGLILNVAADGVGDAATTSGIEMKVMDGGTDIKMMSHADIADYCTIGVTTNGATTLTTVDGGATAANLTFTVDGNIALNAGTTSVTSTDIPLRKYSLPSAGTIGDYSGGDVYYYGSGSTIKGQIYYMASGGGWTLTDADTEVASKGLLAVALGTDPDVDGMLLRGFVTLLTEVEGTEAIGSTLFLSATAGVATFTVPGTGDFVRVIGYSLHATDNQVYFNPAATFVELA